MSNDDIDATDAGEAGPGVGVLPRAFAILRLLAGEDSAGLRVTEIAKQVGLTQATVHRTLQALIAQDVVEQCEQAAAGHQRVDALDDASRFEHLVGERDASGKATNLLTIERGSDRLGQRLGRWTVVAAVGAGCSYRA